VASKWSNGDYLERAIPTLGGVYSLPQPWFVYREEGSPLAGPNDGRSYLSHRLNITDFIARSQEEPPSPAASEGHEHSSTHSGSWNGSSKHPSNRLHYYYYSKRLDDPDCITLTKDLPWLRDFQLNHSQDFNQLWLGQAGVSTHAHYDVFDNFYLQLRGHKQFVLAAPDQRRCLRLHPSTHERARQSQLNFSHGDNRLHHSGMHHHSEPSGSSSGGGGLASATPFGEKCAGTEVVLHPGDVLYIPAYTFHQVLALDFTASVNVFSSTVFSDMYTGLRAPGIPSRLQQVDTSVDGSRVRVTVLAHFVRAVLGQTFGLDPAAAGRFLVDELQPRYLPDSTSSSGGREDDANRRSDGGRRQGAGATGAFCDLAVVDEKCPRASAALSAAEIAEIGRVAASVAAGIKGPWERAGTGASAGGSAGSGGTSAGGIGGGGGGGSADAGAGGRAAYGASVMRLLAADYVEDLSAGVLGANRVCLFVKCLKAPTSWATSP
jgi:mannose-6-phosphate isomerase-like protein (cupin superfamily)